MSPARIAKPAAKTEWPSILQFSASALGLVFFWLTALGSFFVGVTSFFSGDGAAGVDMLLVSASAFWVGLLLLPSTGYSLSRLFKRPLPAFQIKDGLKKFTQGLLVTLLPVLLLCGTLTLNSNLGILLPPIHIAVASLTAGVLLWLGLRKLDLGSLQLHWGAFAAGLTAAPFLAITLEVLVGVFFVLLAVFYVTINPDLAASLLHLQQMMPTVQGDPEQLLPFMHDFLSDPVLLSLLLANFALFVPLIEELIKPIAVWALVWGRKLTPAQGFGLGALSGAGFALLENLFSGTSATGWPATATLRIGATAFHIATSALMGWALVRAKEERRYFGVFVVYAFNILMHAAWNGVVVLNALAAAGDAGLGGESFLPFDVPDSALLILLLVTVLSVSILYGMNRRLQASASAPVVTKAKTRATRTKTKTRS